MGWARLLSSQVSSSPLPRAVLRHLLLEHRIGLGSRVLDVGCGHGELVHYLDDLGMDAVGLDESSDNVEAARRFEPRSDFQLVTAPAEQSLDHIADNQPLDLIVVRHLTSYDGNLFCPSSFHATARLLGHLRPGGWFTFLVHRARTRHADKRSHEVTCFARHLSSFPGTCRVSHFADGDLMTLATDWLLGHRHSGEFLAASLRIPQQPVSASDWQLFAITAAASFDDACCVWPTQIPIRSAA